MPQWTENREVHSLNQTSEPTGIDERAFFRALVHPVGNENQNSRILSKRGDDAEKVPFEPFPREIRTIKAANFFLTKRTKDKKNR
jgi:hypothetical protein